MKMLPHLLQLRLGQTLTGRLRPADGLPVWQQMHQQMLLEAAAVAAGSLVLRLDQVTAVADEVFADAGDADQPSSAAAAAAAAAAVAAEHDDYGYSFPPVL